MVWSRPMPPSPRPILRTIAALAISVAPVLAAPPARAAASATATATAPSPAEPPAAQLVEQAFVQLRVDPAQAEALATRAIARLRQQPDVDLTIRARLVLCEYFAERDAASAAAEIAAIDALIGQATRKGLASGLLTCRGERLETLGDTAQAQLLYDRAVGTAEAARDDEMLASALYSRGYLQGMQGHFAQSLADLRRSQELYEMLGRPQHAMTVLNATAITYNRMGDHHQALQIYDRALELQRAAGLKREQVVTTHNIGRAAENLRDWRRARAAFETALSLSRELRYERGEAYALRGLASVSVAEQRAQDALPLLDAAESLQRNTPDARLAALIDLARGMALRALDQPVKARELLMKALNSFRRGDVQGEMATTYDELAAVDGALGDWRRAYQWKEASKVTSERLLRNQLDQRFATLRVEFDTARQQQENEALRRENEARGQALSQSRLAKNLQYTVLALTGLLAVLLATLAWHQRRSSQRMRLLAMTDELTGLPNRRAVLARIPQVLEPDAQPTTLLIFDIDHFKQINDSFGHAVGDDVLNAVAERLRGALQAPEFYGRIGGEEFLIALPRTTLREGLARAEFLRVQIASIQLPGRIPENRAVTASFGMTLSVPGDSVGTLLQRADAALYRAKRGGRNRVVCETQRESAADTQPVEALQGVGDNGPHPAS
jgi:diguanylate cyclase (GGDEF)-like protein